MRYEVYYGDCEGRIEFNSIEEADRCARLTDGTVFDTETGDIVSEYGFDDDEDLLEYAEEWDEEEEEFY